MTMDHYHILSILLFLVIIFSLTSGRTIFNDDENSYSNEDEQQNSLLDLSSHFSNNNNKKEFHQRSISTLSSTSQSRQEIIDLLRKAYHQGWKPSIKHYMPSSRFGRNG